jgi:NADH dehydrogenase
MNILLIGGSGFIGAAIARRLAAAGHNVTVPSRRPERAAPLRVLPTVEVVAADVHDPAQLAALMQGRDAVINLVGILRGDFQRAHVDLPRAIATAACAAGVTRLLHMSALGAAANGPSAYLRSKAAGEAAVRNVADARQGQLDVTVFRPSVVFGAGDHFLNLFAGLLAVAPLLPLACPDARFQPVWVEDVAACFAAALERPDSIGQCYELAGPTVYTLAELVRYAGRVSGHPRPVIGLPDSLSYLQALLMELVPGGPMTRDNYLSMQTPNVASAVPLPFDCKPTALEAVAPAYLGTALPRRRFTAYCRRARR